MIGAMKVLPAAPIAVFTVAEVAESLSATLSSPFELQPSNRKPKRATMAIQHKPKSRLQDLWTSCAASGEGNVGRTENDTYLHLREY
jgi:hypothetical protein